MAYLLLNEEIKGAVLLDKVKEIIDNGDYFVITDDKLLPFLGGISYQQNPYPLGEYLSQLVQEKIKTETGDYGKLLPLYIQPPPMG